MGCWLRRWSWWKDARQSKGCTKVVHKFLSGQFRTTFPSIDFPGAVAGVVVAHTRVSSRTSQSCTNAVTCHAQILHWRVTYSSCDMTFVTFLVCTGKNLVWRLFVLFVQIFAPISAVSLKTPDLPQNHDPQMTSWRKGWTPTFVFIALISAATLFL